MFYAIEKPNSEEMLTEFQPSSQLKALMAKARRLSGKRNPETCDYDSVYLIAATSPYRADACGQIVYYGGAISWKDGEVA